MQFLAYEGFSAIFAGISAQPTHCARQKNATKVWKAKAFKINVPRKRQNKYNLRAAGTSAALDFLTFFNPLRRIFRLDNSLSWCLFD